MEKFTVVGYDIKTTPNRSWLTADGLAWERDESTYRLAVESGFQENLFQILQIDAISEMEQLRKIVASAGTSAVIIELALLNFVAVTQAQRWCEKTCGLKLAPSDVTAVEYDVCDINGFFSIYEMGVIDRKVEKLDEAAALIAASEMSQAANLLVPSHAPFVTVRIRVVA